MRTRRTTMALVAPVVAAGLVLSMHQIGLWGAERAQSQRVPVKWHMQTGTTEPVGAGAEAQLVRRADGISFSLRAAELPAQHAYTLWLVVVNNPAACDPSPCTAPDIINNPATSSQVVYGAGHVAGASGRAAFSGARTVGDIPEGWLAGRGLIDPFGAEVHLVVNDHGPVLDGYMPEMIRTYRAGCTNESLPPIFPQTARDDGTPGPNACRLTQVAVFLPPDGGA